MKLSEHFDSSEFVCKCGKCELKPIDPELIKLLELVRKHFGQPVAITSGYRCEAHNKAVGGAPNSQHCLGIAADIKVKGVLPAHVYNYLGMHLNGTGGLGLYSGWTHVDVRPGRGARWTG